MKRLYALGMAYLALVMVLVSQETWAFIRSHQAESAALHAQSPLAGSSGADWFRAMKARCNSLEAGVAIKKHPPPAGSEGMGYAAACYALAGKFVSARALIESLPAADRSDAAGIVFNIGHPVADQGDDESAGPIMDFVVQYQPDNYMALYHAGMSQFIIGEYEKSGVNMRRFLEIYKSNDHWRKNGEKVLRRLDQMK